MPLPLRHPILRTGPLKRATQDGETMNLKSIASTDRPRLPATQHIRMRSSAKMVICTSSRAATATDITHRLASSQKGLKAFNTDALRHESGFQRVKDSGQLSGCLVTISNK